MSKVNLPPMPNELWATLDADQEDQVYAYAEQAVREALAAQVPLPHELPHWEEVSAKLERDETLTPLEFFIYENEPASADAWRDQLAAALASTPVAGEAVAHAVISYGRIQRLVVNEESAHEYAEQQRLNAEAAGWDAKAHVRPLVYGDAAPQGGDQET
ncbi:hypothetical protein [Achromobacter insolitus]|uniref:hypothetical protein n=1 Tax=Achromobacter insolitus TaxID=217204 RepID=UPI002FE01571